jgi:hypothetical protein
MNKINIDRVIEKHVLLTSLLVISLFCTLFSDPVYAAESMRLKKSLESEHFYLPSTIEDLNESIKRDKKAFKESLDDRDVVLKGRIHHGSVSKNGRSMTIFSKDGNNSVELDTSSDITLPTANSLKTSVGEYVTVYGRLNVNGLNGSLYSIKAHKLVVGNNEISDADYVTIDNVGYSGTINNKLTRDEHVKMYVPNEWQDRFVSSELANNRVTGYQYTLNAISPGNIKYPENFYVFYFINETYLKELPKNLDEYREVEKAIVKNILQKMDEDIKVSISGFTDTFGNKWDYSTTTYRPKDGNDYRLEFLFKPDQKGLVCMLYLYFPKEGEVVHTQEAAYFAMTMEDTMKLK